MKIFVLTLTDAGYDFVDSEPILFSSLVVKSQTMDDARLIAASHNAKSDKYVQAWTNPRLSKCQNISFYGDDNSVIFEDAV